MGGHAAHISVAEITITQQLSGRRNCGARWPI